MIGKVYGPIGSGVDVIDDTPGRIVVRASSGRLWSVFRYYDSGEATTHQLLCAYSDDGGETWSDPPEVIVELSSKTGGFQFVTGAIDSNDNLHIAYLAYDLGVYPEFGGVYYRMRTDGVGWGDEEIVDESAWYYCTGPVIAVDSSDNVHVVYGYADEDGYDIRHRERASGSWGSPEIVWDWLGTEPYPALAVGGDDKLHVVSVVEGYIRYKTKSGGVWSDEEIVRAGSGWSPVITLDSNDLPHVAWFEGAPVVYYSWRSSGGVWSDVESVSEEEGTFGDFLSIASDRKGDVYVAWVQEENTEDHTGWSMWCRPRGATGWGGGRSRVFPVGYASF